jgi:hypothetical protein
MTFFDYTHPQEVASKISNEVKSKWQIDPVKENDCNYLQDRVKQLGIEISSLLSTQHSSYEGTLTFNGTYNTLIDLEKQYNSKIATLKCVEKAEESRKQADIAKITEEQKKAYEAPLPPTGLDNKTEQKSTTSNATKYILVAVGTLLITIIGISIFKKK